MRAVNSNTPHKAKRAADWRFHDIDPPPGISGADYRFLNRDRLCAAVLEFFAKHRRRSHLAVICHADLGFLPHTPFGGDVRPYLAVARKAAGSVTVAVLPANGDLIAYYAGDTDDVIARDAFERFSPQAMQRTIALPASRRRAAA